MPDFLFVASLGGGVLTLLMLWMKNNPLPSLAVRWPWYARLQDKESGVPYGIALSLGALMAWPQTQIWAAAFAQ
jgi:prepilin peptidase CpaA